jgi:hypothetical protein
MLINGLDVVKTPQVIPIAASLLQQLYSKIFTVNNT